MVLARRSDGTIRAVDVFNYATGEMMSKTLRRGFIPVAAQASRGLLEKLTGQESDFVHHLSDMQAMTDNLTKGRPQDVLQTYQRLPPSLKEDKIVLMLRLRAAQQVSNEEYVSAFEDLRRALPSDASVDLMAIDYYLIRKEYADSLASVDRLDKAVGGDPSLDVLRANVHRMTKDFVAARKAARSATEREPELIVAYWTLVTISLDEKQFGETLQLLKTIREKFAVEFTDLTTTPEYAPFVQSPFHTQWLEYLQTVPSGASGAAGGQK